MRLGRAEYNIIVVGLNVNMKLYGIKNTTSKECAMQIFIQICSVLKMRRCIKRQYQFVLLAHTSQHHQL